MCRIASSAISNSDRIIGITLPLFSSKREFKNLSFTMRIHISPRKTATDAVRQADVHR